MLKKSIPTKEELSRYFIEDNMTAKEMSVMFDKHVVTIFQWLKFYGIKKRKDLRHIKSLSAIQKEMINGSMLGDGSCSEGSKNWYFSKTQSKIPRGKVQGEGYKDKKDYMLWHLQVLEELGNKLYEQKNKSTSINGKEICSCDVYRVCSHAHPVFTEIGHKWHKKQNNDFVVNKNGFKVKQIPIDLKLTPLTVAVWLCDDGIHKPQCKMVSFCTDSFSVEENNFLIYRFKNDIGINAYLGDRNRIFIKDHPNQDYFKFISIVRPYVIWPCFQYKVNICNYKFCALNGENHWKAKLTEEQVKEIITLRMQGFLLREIAEKMDTSKGHIHSVLLKSWKQLDKPILKEAINKKNKSGATGVYQYGNSKFFSQIMVHNKKYRVGPFNSKEEAIEARQNLEKKFGR